MVELIILTLISLVLIAYSGWVIYKKSTDPEYDKNDRYHIDDGD